MDRSFAAEMARRRHQPDRAYSLIVFGLAVVGVAVLGLFRDGSTVFGQGVVTVGGLFLLAGAGLLVLRRRRLRAAADALARGAEAEGTVMAIRRRWPSRAYAIHFRFRGPSGREVQSKQAVSQEEAFRWREGDTGLVLVDPGHPARSVWVGRGEGSGENTARNELGASGVVRSVAAPGDGRRDPPFFRLALRSSGVRKALLYLVPGVVVFGFTAIVLASGNVRVESDTSVAGTLALVAAVILALAAWPLLRGVREVREWQRLLRDGEPTEAVITLVKETYEQVGGGRKLPLRTWGWIISYRYTDRQGAARSGESGYLSRREASACRVGDACVIRYDPKKPASSVWIGRAGVERSH